MHLEKAVINATSTQYSAFYFILTDLLGQSSSATNSFRRKIEGVTGASDISDFQELDQKVLALQKSIRACRYVFHVLLRVDEHSIKLSEQEKRAQLHLEMVLERMRIQLSIIIKSIELAGSKNAGKSTVARTWNVNAYQVILHILEDNRKPLTDLAVAQAKYVRVETQNGSNSNSLEVAKV